MRFVVLRRSLAAAAAITLLTIPTALAETVEADYDLVTAGSQNVVDLGTVAPGADVHVNLYFTLTCSGTSHVNANQAVKLTPSTRIIPLDGGWSMSTFIFGLGSAWPADGEPCPADIAPTVGGPMAMIVTAPSVPGTGYRYFFSWTPSVTPASTDDATVFALPKPSVTFTLNVAAGATNTAPTLNLPADSTVEGNRVGGATAAYTVSASDLEDLTAPTPTCTPAAGAALPLGANTISCTVTDSGGLTTTGSFQITVVDTTAPTLVGMPGSISLTTSNPSGTTLTYTAPTATDIVDTNPTVGCSPASGSSVPVGDTTVTCTATDHSGNSSSAGFAVHVSLSQASWEDPVGAGAGIVINGSRTIPVKVQLLLDGQPVTSGAGLLSVVPCGGGTALMTDDLAIQSNGRWMGHLSTDGLAAGCYQVVASIDGVAIGSFRMDVRTGTTTAAKAAASTAHVSASGSTSDPKGPKTPKP